MAPELNELFLFIGDVASNIPSSHSKLRGQDDGTAFYEDMDIPIFQADNTDKNCQDAELFNHPGQFVHWSQGVVDEPDDCENIRFVFIYRVLLGNVYEGGSNSFRTRVNRELETTASNTVVITTYIFRNTSPR